MADRAYSLRSPSSQYYTPIPANTGPPKSAASVSVGSEFEYIRTFPLEGAHMDRNLPRTTSTYSGDTAQSQYLPRILYEAPPSTKIRSSSASEGPRSAWHTSANRAITVGPPPDAVLDECRRLQGQLDTLARKAEDQKLLVPVGSLHFERIGLDDDDAGESAVPLCGALNQVKEILRDAIADCEEIERRPMLASVDIRALNSPASDYYNPIPAANISRPSGTVRYPAAAQTFCGSSSSSFGAIQRGGPVVKASSIGHGAVEQQQYSHQVARHSGGQLSPQSFKSAVVSEVVSTIVESHSGSGSRQLPLRSGSPKSSNGFDSTPQPRPQVVNRSGVDSPFRKKVLHSPTFHAEEEPPLATAQSRTLSSSSAPRPRLHSPRRPAIETPRPPSPLQQTSQPADTNRSGSGPKIVTAKEQQLVPVPAAAQDELADLELVLRQKEVELLQLRLERERQRRQQQ